MYLYSQTPWNANGESIVRADSSKPWSNSTGLRVAALTADAKLGHWWAIICESPKSSLLGRAERPAWISVTMHKPWSDSTGLRATVLTADAKLESLRRPSTAVSNSALETPPTASVNA